MRPSTARSAAREFLSSGRRPDNLSWDVVK
ncbi:Imm1 family immunity protein [Plantactinospora sp. WMMC1484]